MNVTITLPADQMAVVVQAVESGPYRVVAPIMRAIEAQLEQQRPDQDPRTVREVVG